MKNVLSSLAIVVVLAALGLSTMVALPRGLDATAAAPAGAPSIEVANAPAATQNYNVIAIPLAAQGQFSDAGFPYTADGLAKLVGSSVTQVLRWDSAGQIYEFWLPQDQDGVDFNLQTGGTYWLLVDSAAPPVVSFVGDVPAQGSINFSLVGNPSACLYNEISLPLDKSSITNADQLASAVGNVVQVLRWDASTQQYEFWLPQDQDGVNFAVKIGYPYTLCMSQGKTWPAP